MMRFGTILMTLVMSVTAWEDKMWHDDMMYEPEAFNLADMYEMDHALFDEDVAGVVRSLTDEVRTQVTMRGLHHVEEEIGKDIAELISGTEIQDEQDFWSEMISAPEYNCDENEADDNDSSFGECRHNCKCKQCTYKGAAWIVIAIAKASKKWCGRWESEAEWRGDGGDNNDDEDCDDDNNNDDDPDTPWGSVKETKETPSWASWAELNPFTGGNRRYKRAKCMYCKAWRKAPRVVLGFVSAMVRPLSDAGFWCAGAGYCRHRGADLFSTEKQCSAYTPESDEEWDQINMPLELPFNNMDTDIGAMMNLDDKIDEAKEFMQDLIYPEEPSSTLERYLKSGKSSSEQGVCKRCFVKTMKFVIQWSIKGAYWKCKKTRCPFIRGLCRWSAKHKEFAFGSLVASVEPWKYALGRCWKSGGEEKDKQADLWI